MLVSWKGEDCDLLMDLDSLGLTKMQVPRFVTEAVEEPVQAGVSF